MATTNTPRRAAESQGGTHVVSPQLAHRKHNASSDGVELDRATKRLKLHFPNVTEDLCKLIRDIQGEDVTEVTRGILQLLALLNKEKHEGTSLALNLACGHAEILRAAMKHAEHPVLQVAAFKTLNVLSSYRPSVSDSEVDNMRLSLLMLGAIEHAFDAIHRLPDKLVVAIAALGMVHNLMGLCDGRMFFANGNSEAIVRVMKKFPRQANVQSACCDIISSMGQWSHDPSIRSLLEKSGAVSAIAEVIEGFDTSSRVYVSAKKAMRVLVDMEGN